MNWTVHHRSETASTNLDARGAAPWNAFTADFQTAGRGRLDHRWHSAGGVNLMMSAVVPVDAMPPEEAATFPLVAGLAVVDALSTLCPDACAPFLLKWPNDVYVGGRKICGILCERDGERIIAGIGVNVGERSFPAEIAARATSLALVVPEVPSVTAVRDAVLAALAALHAVWRRDGFTALHQRIAAVDFLRGQRVEVVQTDADSSPVVGVSGGIRVDGSLDVGGNAVFAGEVRLGKGSGWYAAVSGSMGKEWSKAYTARDRACPDASSSATARSLSCRRSEPLSP